MKGRLWTEEEIAYVKNNYQTLSPEQMAVSLKRTVRSVRTLMCRKRFVVSYRRPWSDGDEGRLRDLVRKGMHPEQISVELGRSVTAITTKLSKIGLQTKDYNGKRTVNSASDKD